MQHNSPPPSDAITSLPVVPPSNTNDGFASTTASAPRQNNIHPNPSMSSMTLAISYENAKRMLEASRAFNCALEGLKEEAKQRQKNSQGEQQQSTAGGAGGGGGDALKKEDVSGDCNAMDEDSPSKTDAAPCDRKRDTAAQQQPDGTGNSSFESSGPTDSASSSDGAESPSSTSKATSINDLLLPAALSCGNGLLSYYVKQMQAARAKGVITTLEIEVCLLLFLDMDKSNKLLSAFELLSRWTQDASDDKRRQSNNQATNNTDGENNTDSDGDAVMNKSPQFDPSKVKAEPNETLSSNSNEDGEPNKASTSTTTEKTTITALELPTLDRSQLMRLFRCLLSSISTCIHHNSDEEYHGQDERESRKTAKGGECDSPSSSVARKISMESPVPVTSTKLNTNANASSAVKSSYLKTPSSVCSKLGVGIKEEEYMSTLPPPTLSPHHAKDWTLSNDTEDEICEIANYATDRVIAYVRTEKLKETDSATTSSIAPSTTTSTHSQIVNNATPTARDPTVSVDFQIFGGWYNSGGFSLVPWLELLDLAKWDYAGKAAAAAATASAENSKHGGGTKYPERYARQKESMMDSPMEERGDRMTVESSLALGNDGAIQQPQPSALGDRGRDRFSDEGNDRFGDHRHHRIGGSPSDNLFYSSPRSARRSVASTSRILMSFEFGSSSISSNRNERQHKQRHRIDISADNLTMLQNLVQRTSLCKCNPEEIAKVLMRHSKRRRIPVSSSGSRSVQTPRLEEVMMVLSRQDFGKCIRDLVPPDASSAFSETEMERFSNFFTNFFLCFGKINYNSSVGLDIEHVNVRELIVGFSFLCAGNKSAKLSTIFEVIEEQNAGFLSQRKLLRYLRSYLTMLVGISLLSSSTKMTTESRRALLAPEDPDGLHSRLLIAAESGARWTLDHFLRYHEGKLKKNACDRSRGNPVNNGMISFDNFASWYTDEGYNIASWLEFLDLKKFLSLLTDDTTYLQQDNIHSRSTGGGAQRHGDRSSRPYDERYISGGAASESSTTRNRPRPSRPIHAPYPPAPSADVLFTFPLANHHSLVVLRADAVYVRTVVNRLGLLSKAPEEVWSGLYRHVQESPPSPLPWRYAQHHNSGTGKSVDVDQSTFVTALENVVPKVNKRKRPSSPSICAKETLTNFFQSFDLDQVDRVAANQLMGGLTLLCGGKKSAKLAFSFGLFDGRSKEEKKKGKHNQSLKGKELFYFLRSFLIVMFSCCKQSLDLSADAVGRYISDTANKVTDDVMKYIWRERRSDRVDFEQFGEWYNEGGFETAPWLELLDLNKWVLLDEPNSSTATRTASISAPTPPVTEAKTSSLKERIAPRPQLREANVKINAIKVKNEKENIQTTPNKSETVGPKDILSEPISDCPPPPSDDLLDPASDMFFDDMGMDDIDFLFHDTSGRDKENIDSTTNNDTVGISDAPILPKMSGVGDSEVDLEQQHQEASTDESKQLKFHLLTSDNQSGYVISISPRRKRLLKHLIIESDLCHVNITTACEMIFAEAVEGKLKKSMFDAAMRKIIASKMTTETQRLLSDLLSAVYSAFDLNNAGEVDARELACGFTVLCGGRKSDKLEYAFGLLEGGELFSRADMVLYLQSFLTVLLSMSSCPIGREPSEDILGSLNGTTSSVSRVIGWGSSWATEQVFKSTPLEQKVTQGDTELINFDSFADWYTTGGFRNTQWLELLDLHKWVLADL